MFTSFIVVYLSQPRPHRIFVKIQICRTGNALATSYCREARKRNEIRRTQRQQNKLMSKSKGHKNGVDCLLFIHDMNKIALPSLKNISPFFGSATAAVSPVRHARVMSSSGDSTSNVNHRCIFCKIAGQRDEGKGTTNFGMTWFPTCVVDQVLLR